MTEPNFIHGVDGLLTRLRGHEIENRPEWVGRNCVLFDYGIAEVYKCQFALDGLLLQPLLIFFGSIAKRSSVAWYDIQEVTQ
jgi:hypothetical protein